MNPIRTILFPTDFSDYSRYAFHLASTLACAHGAKLVVAHVNQTLGPMVAFNEALTHLQPEEYRKKLNEVLHKFQVSDSRVEVEYQMADGDAASEILRLADQVDCDLIVMGSHGRTGLDRFLLGSVAEQVLRKAECPVLTVKQPSHAWTERKPSRSKELAAPIMN